MSGRCSWCFNCTRRRPKPRKRLALAVRSSISGCVTTPARGGKALLDRRTNAHRRGKGRLTDAEARRVQSWIKDKCPEQLKLPYALWTAGVVRELIRRRLGKHLGLSTVQLYLLKWGFTPHDSPHF